MSLREEIITCLKSHNEKKLEELISNYYVNTEVADIVRDISDSADNVNHRRMIYNAMPILTSDNANWGTNILKFVPNVSETSSYEEIIKEMLSGIKCEGSAENQYKIIESMLSLKIDPNNIPSTLDIQFKIMAVCFSTYYRRLKSDDPTALKWIAAFNGLVAHPYCTISDSIRQLIHEPFLKITKNRIIQNGHEKYIDARPNV